MNGEGFGLGIRRFQAIAVLGVLFTLFSNGFAQTQNQVQSPQDGPRPFRPAITLVIHKHSTGADMVEVSVLSPNYRPTELATRLQNLGKGLGSEARGLNLFAQDMTPKNPSPGSPKLVFLKATFAVDGILNGPAGIRLQPLVQAFAGGQGEERVDAMEVFISGETGNPSTVHHFASPAVEVAGQSVGQPPMLDYHIWLLSQKPEQILIPDMVSAPVAAAPIQEKTTISPLWLWGGILLVAGAVAILVYNLSLRGGPPGSNRTGTRPQSVNRVP